jgi:hypothetical protein
VLAERPTLHLEVLCPVDVTRATQDWGKAFSNELVKFGVDENESQFWWVRWCGSSRAWAYPMDVYQENLGVMCSLFVVNPKGD